MGAARVAMMVESGRRQRRNGRGDTARTQGRQEDPDVDAAEDEGQLLIRRLVGDRRVGVGGGWRRIAVFGVSAGRVYAAGAQQRRLFVGGSWLGDGRTVGCHALERFWRDLELRCQVLVSRSTDCSRHGLRWLVVAASDGGAQVVRGKRIANSTG